MKQLLLFSLLVLSLVSCRKGKSDAPPSRLIVQSDSLLPDASADSVAAPPKAADGLFDDFIYSFMRNKRFQRQRIQFPLTNVVDGTDKPITKEQWTYDPLYVKQDVYTTIFDSEKSTRAQKDTSLRHVEVEWVYLNRRRVKQYIFNKVQGEWMLTALNTHAFAENVNSDFYAFYRRFATETAFQNAHIANPFHFKTYDSDNFQTIEGVMDASQWPDYRPELPHGTITNINYGQTYGNARRRVLMICSQSGGMGCSLTFVRSGKTWLLEKLVN